MVAVHVQVKLVASLVEIVPVGIRLGNDEKIDFFEERLELSESKVSDEPERCFFP